MRVATIRVRRDVTEPLDELRGAVAEAWRSGEYGGEFFDFESPAALFRLLTPKRWDLVERLQAEGPLGVRALGRALGRDVRRVHDDVKALLEAGLVEKDEAGKLVVPFDEIRADFRLCRVAA